MERTYNGPGTDLKRIRSEGETDLSILTEGNIIIVTKNTDSKCYFIMIIIYIIKLSGYLG